VPHPARTHQRRMPNDLIFPEVALDGFTQWSLSDALLCYRASDEYGRAQHAVFQAPVTVDGAGVPQIGALRPVSAAFLAALRARTAAKVPLEFLPPHVLCRMPGTIVWWTPPCVRRLCYGDQQGEFSQLHGYEVHLPAFVWRLTNGRTLAIRAVAGTDRPSPDTALAVAPVWNVYDDGGVCLGSMRAPHRDAVECIGEWVDGFWGSAFTHPNANRGALVRHPEGFFGAWVAARTLPFADAWLVPAKQTLAEFVRSARAQDA
jgi:PRTRC genetic system protein B